VGIHSPAPITYSSYVSVRMPNSFINTASYPNYQVCYPAASCPITPVSNATGSCCTAPVGLLIGVGEVAIYDSRDPVPNSPLSTCNPVACGSQGAACGTVNDWCGTVLSCGTCASSAVCGAITPNQCCQPATCSSLGFSCGTASDGCGGTLNCGAACGTGSSCVSNKCVACATCASQGQSCGTLNDGCGHVLTCNNCPSGQTCNSSNQCVVFVPPPVPAAPLPLVGGLAGLFLALGSVFLARRRS
jgi:hypothetical protein